MGTSHLKQLKVKNDTFEVVGNEINVLFFLQNWNLFPTQKAPDPAEACTSYVRRILPAAKTFMATRNSTKRLRLI